MGKDGVVGVEDVVPESRVEGLDLSSETTAHEHVPELGAKREEDRIAEGVPSVTATEGVVAYERTQTVRGDDVPSLGVPETAHDPLSALLTKIVVLDPLDDHPRRAAHEVRRLRLGP